jgi:hypothetical protein
VNALTDEPYRAITLYDQAHPEECAAILAEVSQTDELPPWKGNW